MVKQNVHKLISKVLFLSAIILFTFHTIFAQMQKAAYKLAEYESPQGSSCDEYFRMIDFLEKINQEKDSKGLVVIYSGDSSERYGNLLAYISGAEKYLTKNMGVVPDKVSFVIAEGKSLFNEEFWIIPQNSETPKIRLASWDSAKLQKKYYFSQTCVVCEPSYYLLTSFQPNYQEYAAILKKNPKYKGLIVGSNFESLMVIRKTLVREHKLSKERFSLQIKKGRKGKSNLTEGLYIIPTYK